MNWLRNRDWNHIGHNALYTVAIVAGAAAIILTSHFFLSGKGIEHTTENCSQIKFEGAWFPDMDICEFELPNGVGCYAVEFGDGGGLYCD